MANRIPHEPVPAGGPERRLQSVLDGMDEAFGLMDHSFRILAQNRRALELDGRPAADIIGRSHWEVYPGTETSEIGLCLKRALAEQVPVTLEHRYTWWNGQVRWLDMRAYPVPEGLAVFWRDITERRAAEERLRESETKYRALFNSMDEAYAVVEVIKDATGRWSDFLFLEVNPAFMKHTGMPYPVGRTATDLLGTPNPRWAENYGYVVDTGEPVRMEEAELTLGRVFDLNIFRLGDRQSRRVAVLFTDITARKQTEQRLRDSKVRLASIFASATVGLSEIALDGRILQANDELCRILGRRRSDVLRLNIADVTHPDDLPVSLAAVAFAGHGKPGPGFDKRYLRPDGSMVWAKSRVALLRHGPNEPDTILAVTMDISDRRATEAALWESEGRFRQFGNASSDVLWIRDAATLAFEYVSPAFETVYGARIDDIVGGDHVLRWADMILPEDRDKALSNLHLLRGGEQVTHNFRIRRPDGQIRWLRNTDFPLRDAEGRVQRIGGIAHDATEELELQERLKVLVAELQHRSRNLVGVVQAVSERTLATSETLPEFRCRFRARLSALGRVNGLLSRLDEGERITFDKLLQTELRAHGVVDSEEFGNQVSLDGPDGIPLPSATVQTFALAIHELTTNALKHGALSRAEGRLSVTWGLTQTADSALRLRVDWVETGVPVQHPDRDDEAQGPSPLRKGYGRELIERALPYQLKAETLYQLTADGVRCTLFVPVSTTIDLAFSEV